MQISVLGRASGRVTTLTVREDELTENLLTWLRKNGITIASSCDGEGVCKKCVIQNDWLSCLFTLESFLKVQSDGVVRISYL